MTRSKQTTRPFSDPTTQRRLEMARKLSSGSAKSVGIEWRDAAADFLAAGDNYKRLHRVESILSDPRMKNFLTCADSVFDLHNRQQRERDARDGTRGFAFSFHRYRQTIIALMAFEGGPLATETVREITKRRQKLAPLARRLASGLAAEPGLPRIVYSRLLALADRLECDAPLCALDPIELARAPSMPQSKRPTAKQLLLERLLCEEFRARTGGPQHSLVATAVEVSLNSKSAIGVEGVRKREKSYRKSRPG